MLMHIQLKKLSLLLILMHLQLNKFSLLLILMRLQFLSQTMHSNKLTIISLQCLIMNNLLIWCHHNSPNNGANLQLRCLLRCHPSNLCTTRICHHRCNPNSRFPRCQFSNLCMILTWHLKCLPKITTSSKFSNSTIKVSKTRLICSPTKFNMLLSHRIWSLKIHKIER